MGFYIDPTNSTKEEWLATFGEEIAEPSWPPKASMVFVCLVDNGPFKAAGIAFSEAEFDAFKAPDLTTSEIATLKVNVIATGMNPVVLDKGNQRPRTWYVVSRKDIVRVCPHVEEMLEECV